jgi:hypothetical protein
VKKKEYAGMQVQWCSGAVVCGVKEERRGEGVKAWWP